MGAYHVTHDWDGAASLSETIRDAIEAVSGTDVSDSDLLNAGIDVTALDELFGSHTDAALRDGNNMVLEFPFGEYRITARSSGDIRIFWDSNDVIQAEIPDEQAFQTEFRRLLRGAEANGIDVEGGWNFLDEDLEWGVEIFEVSLRRKKITQIETDST